MAKMKSLRVASDKSITHRALMLSSISKGTVKINNPLYSDDTLKTAMALQKLGVSLTMESGRVTVIGKGKYSLKEPSDIIDLGNSGTSMRLLSGLIGGEGIFTVLTGDNSLRNRPMLRIIQPLQKMGIRFLYREGGYAPLAIKGGDIGGINFINKLSSAQVKSAILIAGLYTNEDVVVSEPVKSRDHTENMLRSFGVDIYTRENSIKLGKNRELLGNFDINVPADISSAAYFMVYGVLHSKEGLLLRDVLLNPTRSGILDIFDRCGANYEVDNIRTEGYEKVGDIKLFLSKNLKPFQIDGAILPRLIDEVPILSILAIFCDGVSSIRGAGDLRKKESDRIHSICENLKRIGVKVVEYDDGFDIYGSPSIKLKPAKIDTFNDHRIAMSFLTLRAVTSLSIQLSESKSILTSYPNFLDHLNYISG